MLKGSDIKNYSVRVEVPEISKEPGAALEGSDSTSFAGIRASSADKAEKKREVKNIRVDIDRLDHMMNLVEDLVINRGRREQIAHQYKIKELDEALKHGRQVAIGCVVLRWTSG